MAARAAAVANSDSGVGGGEDGVDGRRLVRHYTDERCEEHARSGTEEDEEAEEVHGGSGSGSDDAIYQLFLVLSYRLCRRSNPSWIL